MCGQLRASDIGNRATVMGFVAKYRNLGNLLFVDVRDRTGVVQVAFDDSCDRGEIGRASCRERV